MPRSRPSIARIYRGTPRNLAMLAKRLRAGELVAVPTETVYGLAANALDARACHAIFHAKGRPLGDPLIVHIHSLDQLDEICEPNAAALQLAKRFWPGPLTMVLPKKAVVPAIATAGQPSVAVRMPAHPLFRRLLKLGGIPLAAPSANPFGYISPTTATHVRQNLGRKIPAILDGGPAEIGVESTIIDLRNPAQPRLLRPGAITIAELTRALRRPVLFPRTKSADKKGRTAQIAPGLLARHYSPHKPVSLHEAMAAPSKSTEAYIFFRRPARGEIAAEKNVFWLDETGDLRGAARRLFAILRRLDDSDFKRIHVELAQATVWRRRSTIAYDERQLSSLKLTAREEAGIHAGRLRSIISARAYRRP